MAIGMSYDDYWNGDPHMVRYYIKLDELNKQRKNNDAWLIGLYTYKALEAYRELIGMAKHPKVYPYIEEPVPITEEQIRKKEEEKKRLELERMKAAMMRRAMQINASIGRREDDVGDSN